VTAKRKRAKPAAAPKLVIPTRLADVAGWAEAMRARRLNDDGRAAIDLAELLLTETLATAQRAKSGTVRLRAMAIGMPLVEKQLRVALQADRAEADHEIVRLRQLAESQQRAESALDRMH
jgi:hypothetical protein